MNLFEEIFAAVRRRWQNDTAAFSTPFVVAVATLGAKMAKADGPVNHDEVDAFKHIFRIAPNRVPTIARIFNRATRQSGGFEPYAKRIARLFRHSPTVLEELVYCLAYVARSDGTLHHREIVYLRSVADIFGLDARAFERATAIRPMPEWVDTYDVLGVGPEDSKERVKSAYRRKVRQAHPDKLSGKGLPENSIKRANRRLAKINAAYERILEDRGLN